jgi:Brp/Blh family beta-carotene 15,15'-monooxygenase
MLLPYYLPVQFYLIKMMRSVLIIVGFLLLIIQQYIQPLSVQLQFFIFLAGIVIIGIPHGAADLLVATQNAGQGKRTFSKLIFFINYLGRLFLFAAILWLLPLAGILLFIVFAAYHFGETDLYQFKTDNIAGKLFVISYGLVILGIILLHHYEEVEPILLLLDPGLKYQAVTAGLEKYRYTILSFCGLFFYITTFFYFLTTSGNRNNHGQFLVQFLFILIILYNLPLVLGFTFYFIVWHSVLSLHNIIRYLRKDDLLPALRIAKQISIYSLLAMAGIALFGLSGFMFINNDTMILYIFLGLAVLTAPHMQIMHDMYSSMRSQSKDGQEI